MREDMNELRDFAKVFRQTTKATFIDWLLLEGYASQIPYETYRYTACRMAYTEAEKWASRLPEEDEYFDKKGSRYLTPAADIIDVSLETTTAFPQAVYALVYSAAKDAKACGHSFIELLEALREVRKYDDWETPEEGWKILLESINWGKKFGRMHLTQNN